MGLARLPLFRVKEEEREDSSGIESWSLPFISVCAWTRVFPFPILEVFKGLEVRTSTGQSSQVLFVSLLVPISFRGVGWGYRTGWGRERGSKHDEPLRTKVKEKTSP